ncbi:hypothetical protein, partial [Pseudomonas sp. FEN]
ESDAPAVARRRPAPGMAALVSGTGATHPRVLGRRGAAADRRRPGDSPGRGPPRPRRQRHAFARSPGRHRRAPARPAYRRAAGGPAPARHRQLRAAPGKPAVGLAAKRFRGPANRLPVLRPRRRPDPAAGAGYSAERQLSGLAQGPRRPGATTGGAHRKPEPATQGHRHRATGHSPAPQPAGGAQV